MYDHWGANLTVLLATVAVVAGCVLVHYGGLAWLSRRLQQIRAHRRTVLYAIFAVLALHVLEIWLFGIGYYALLHWPPTGQITGSPATLLDSVYFSASVYTTVGFGDLTPVGPIRLMAGTEGLTGFVLIGWSASFTYLEMERRWRPPH